MSSLHRAIFKDSAIVSALGILTPIFGLLVTRMLAHRFGPGLSLDAWQLAYGLPLAIQACVMGVVKYVFLPVLAEERIRHPEQIQETVGTTISTMLVASLVSVGFVGLLLWLARDAEVFHTAEGRRLVYRLVLELLPIVPLTILAAALYFICQAYQRFAVVEAALAARPLVVIAFLWCFGETWGVHALAWGYVAGQGAVLVITAWMVRRGLGLSLRPRWVFTPAMRTLLWLSIFPILTLLLIQAKSYLSTRYITYVALREGRVTILQFAQNLSVIPLALIGRGFTSVITSHWAKSIAEGDAETIPNSLNRTLSMLVTVVTPGIIAMALLRGHLVKIILFTGKYREEFQIELTADALFFLVLGILPEFISMTVSRIIVAHKRMQLLFWINLFATAVELSLAWWLAHRWDVSGVALALLISKSALVAVMMGFVHFGYAPLRMRGFGWNLPRTAVGLMGMGAAMVCVLRYGGARLEALGLPGQFVALSLLGGVVYLAVIAALRHPDLWAVLSLARRAEPPAPALAATEEAGPSAPESASTHGDAAASASSTKDPE